MKRLFLPAADRDIDRLYAFLVGNNPRAAEKAMLAMGRGLFLIEENPFIGVPVGKDATERHLYIPFGKNAYVLRYRIEEDTIIVIRAWHGRENQE